ncbi:MAG: endonuclease domain-containing protein [Gemmataceae bacterium]|nr:endonuclease domain-containing protein [Gemmataceae bacterium]
MANEFARHLRRNMTDAERRLWSLLRDRQLTGWKFRRQVPVGPYVADFACLERRLIVELDGSQHVEQSDYDAERSTWLVEQGFAVVRFWNHQVFEEPDAVVEAIWQALGATAHPQYPAHERLPVPSPLAGEG